MANFRSIRIVHVLILIFLHLSQALYEDQVGKFDWKRSFLGKVKYVHFEAKRIIVVTEENVLASLNLKNGNIQWRQILEEPPQQILMLHVDRDIVTLSGLKNNYYVRTWDISTGVLLNEWTINAENVAQGEFLVYKDTLVHISTLGDSKLVVTKYELNAIGDSNNNNKGRVNQITLQFAKDSSRCVAVSKYYACPSLDGTSINFIDILSELVTVNNIPLKSSDNNVSLTKFNSKLPGVLTHNGNNLAKLIIFNDNYEIKSENVMNNAVGIDNLIYQLTANDDPAKLVKVEVKNLSNENKDVMSVELEYPIGLGAPEILAGQTKGSITDLLLSTTDDALLLVRLPEGKILWTKEEALANIVATEFFELPVSDLDASIEREFDPAGNIFNMFINRITTQSKQLYNLIFGNQLLSQSGLVRDEFGLHKIIVVATKTGKIFALDSLSGAIAWSYRLPKVKPFHGLDNNNEMLLFVQRTARYAPFPAVCTLMAEDSITGNGIIFQFDPITGYSEEGIQRLNYKILQAMMLPEADQQYLKPILILSQQKDVYIYPLSGFTIARKHFDTTFIYVLDSSTSLLEGYSLKHSTEDTLRVTKVWNVNLSPSKVVALNGKPANERVHSQGRVLYDRSVYYKYVNPNLIAVATISEDPLHKHVLSIYLIDGVTGLIVYSTSHKRARGPVHLVHSENWITYSYLNEKHRRIEVAAAELYEGHIQSNTTVFSSFAVSQLPQVQTQAYIMNANIRTIAVTLTERGITNKFLLFALNNGAVVELPWLLFQPRFNDIPCGPEESCIPYMPEIPLAAEAIINYNQTLAKIRGITVAPARLESTVHVLVHGLDMFYTLVAPSKTFDVLKEDFDHRLIVLVLTGLVIASYVTKQLASRKALKQAWK